MAQYIITEKVYEVRTRLNILLLAQTLEMINTPVGLPTALVSALYVISAWFQAQFSLLSINWLD